MLKRYEGSWLAQICRQEEIIFNEALMEGMMFGYWGGPGRGEDRRVSGQKFEIK